MGWLGDASCIRHDQMVGMVDVDIIDGLWFWDNDASVSFKWTGEGERGFAG
jgi:hypothetical protein